MAKKTSTPDVEKGKKSRSKLNIWNIQGKLIAGFCLIVVLMLGIFGVGYFGLDYVGKGADKVSAGEREQLLWSNWSASINAAISDYEYYFLSKNPEWLNEAEKRWAIATEQENKLSQLTDSSSGSLFSSVSSKVEGMKLILDSLAQVYESEENKLPEELSVS